MTASNFIDLCRSAPPRAAGCLTLSEALQRAFWVRQEQPAVVCRFRYILSSELPMKRTNKKILLSCTRYTGLLGILSLIERWTDRSTLLSRNIPSRASVVRLVQLVQLVLTFFIRLEVGILRRSALPSRNPGLHESVRLPVLAALVGELGADIAWGLAYVRKEFGKIRQNLSNKMPLKRHRS